MVQMQKIHSLFSTQFFNAVLNAAADAAMNAVAFMNAVSSFFLVQGQTFSIDFISV